MRPLARLLALAALTAAAASSALPAFGGTPRGPAFGNNRYRTEISAPAQTGADVDDYVAPLIAGETLSVSVTADPRSPLVPRVTVLDPDGVDRTPAALAARSAGVTSGGGTSAGQKRRASVSFRRLPVAATGPWVVRVAGSDGTSGAYTVTFQVKPAPPVTARKLGLGGADPLEREHPFEAVEGARLTATVKLAKGSAGASIGAVADPSGAPVPFSPGRKRGATTTFQVAPLGKGHGVYGVSMELAEGRATYDLTLQVDVPTRPKGTIALSPFEPRLQLLGAPHQGNSAQVVRLLGANFSTAEKPTVWFGARKATVLQVVFAGGGLDVAPPKLVDPLLEDGALVDVAVVNPDGQAVVMPNYFRYSVPEPAVLAKLTPGTASVYAGDSIRYGVELTRPAPLGGVTIRIATTGAVGATPPAVTIGSGGRTAGFTLVAAQTAATGRVEAVYADVVLLADVTVVAKPTGGGGGDPPPPPPPLPDEIDVSGWTVLQAASARTFTIPAGTKLKQGETLVIGRAATQTAFAAYWGVTFGADVRYLTNDPTNSTTSTDDWPSINGSESFELRDASGATVDGPTAAMGAAGGEDWQRSAGLPAGQKSSWTVSASVAPGSGPTPGAFLSTATAKHGVFISEFADTAGSGNYVYEFVELHFDGLPSQ